MSILALDNFLTANIRLQESFVDDSLTPELFIKTLKSYEALFDSLIAKSLDYQTVFVLKNFLTDCLSEIENLKVDFNLLDFLNLAKESISNQISFLESFPQSNQKRLQENRIKALRHHTKKEAKEIVEKILQALKTPEKFTIVDRDKNNNFLKKEKIGTKGAKKLLELYLEPEDLLAVIPNRDKPGKELYLFSVCVPIEKGEKTVAKKFIYLKIEVLPFGKINAISFHEQNEFFRVDYRQAKDNADAHILENMAKVWKELYNKRPGIESKILDFTVAEDSITFTFERTVSDDDDNIRQDLAASVPKDYGYKYKDVDRNASYLDGKIKIYLPFENF